MHEGDDHCDHWQESAKHGGHWIIALLADPFVSGFHRESSPAVTSPDLPVLHEARLELGAGRPQRAVALLEDAEVALPLEAQIQLLLSTAYEALGEKLKAAAAALAAKALLARDSLSLYNLATGYFLYGHPELAEKWYRVTLLLDPRLALAHQNLAAVLREKGDAAAARKHLHLAYSEQWLFVETSSTPRASVLVLCASGLGNVPVDYLLPTEHFTRIKCMVEYLPASEREVLPAHDIVFNAVGDPDCRAADEAWFEPILRGSQRPVLNPLSKVSHTRRDRLGRLLAPIDQAFVPAVYRVDQSEADARVLSKELAKRRAVYPLILRQAEAHGGQGVTLAQDASEVDRWAAGRDPGDASLAVYATAFSDSRDLQGYYRKYRAFFVAGRAYPYHLAISRHWLVHYFSAAMPSENWKLEEERRYLDDPQSAVGANAWQTIAEIGKATGLDFGGVDFTLRPNGTVLVFEANATMLVHPEIEGGRLDYKNAAVHTIRAAFGEMIVARRAL